MTLTELKYIVALADTLHFGKAAESCFVSQPTLSIGLKKIEEELGVCLFDRDGKVKVTGIGAMVVAQARYTISQAVIIKEIARTGKLLPFNYSITNHSISLLVQ